MNLKRRVPNKPKSCPGGKIALIDADVIRYQAAAVADGTHYRWINSSDAEESSPEIRYKKDIVLWCAENGKDPEHIQQFKVAEPVEFCLHTLKLMVDAIIEGAGCTSGRLFLTGKGNYRETLAITHPYKGTRVAEKPTHFDAAGDYLLKHFYAEVFDGIEADDALGFEHLSDPNNTVLCSVDKDLLMIPGMHYCWSSTSETQKYFDYPYNKVFEVTQEDADRFFYAQLLAGDSVDNIKGLKGVGMKRAFKMLEPLSTPQEMWEFCKGAYEEAGHGPYFILENADLLWIQRVKEQFFIPPDAP